MLNRSRQSRSSRFEARPYKINILLISIEFIEQEFIDVIFNH